MSPIRLIIFDLDGTLIDSLDDLTCATNHMLTTLGRPSVDQGQVRSLVGQGARRLVERALPGAVPAEIDRGLELFLRYNEEHVAVHTDCYPGVIDTLTELQSRGTVMTVVSNKNELLCRKVLELLGLEVFLSGIYGADSLPERKPSPLPLLHVMRMFDVAAGETLMVGDSINDIAAGIGAGVPTVGCRYGYGAPDELRDATWQVNVLTQLLTLPPFKR